MNRLCVVNNKVDDVILTYSSKIGHVVTRTKRIGMADVNAVSRSKGKL
jgi:hypothetical protein